MRMSLYGRWGLTVMLSLLLWSAPAFASERTVFAMADPRGDDRGPGTYAYPRDATFAPHRGLFDLVDFRVVRQDRGHNQEVLFDLTFAEVTNPWRAPEGSSHIRVDIYIDTRDGAGRTEPWREGANVRFAPERGWDCLVRLAPWGESGAVKTVISGGPEARGEQVTSGQSGRDGTRTAVALNLAGPKTLRARVPLSFLGEPSSNWRYYVLVGSFDAFGPDNYRPVTKECGRWVFGGGDDGAVAPNVIDILAPRFGRLAQERQLAAFDVAKGERAVLQPANEGPGGFPHRGLAILLVLAAAGLFIWRRAVSRFRRNT